WTSCVECSIGTYSLNNATAECTECTAKGLICVGGHAIVESGYWPIINKGDQTITTMRCSDGLCLGWDDSNGIRCAPHRISSDSNIMCGSCEDGYAQSNRNCVECNTPNVGYVVLFLIIAVLAVVAIHYISQKSGSYATIFFYFIQTCLLILTNANAYALWMNLFNFSVTDVGGASSDSSSNGGAGNWGICIIPMNPYEE